jgi:hypothetical protein
MLLLAVCVLLLAERARRGTLDVHHLGLPQYRAATSH